MTSPLKSVARAVRAALTSWTSERTLGHLEAIRAFEFDAALAHLPRAGRLLEIGAGTGWQARAFAARGFDVSAIDIPQSNYKSARVWPVIDYDGIRIPFPDHSFDVVFSSNTLEHVPHVRSFQAEMARVLKPDGVAVHLMPTATWHAWSSLTHLLKWWVPQPIHGEHAKSLFGEMLGFSAGRWRRIFLETGWHIEHEGSNRLFYTGTSILDARLPIQVRSRLSRLMGSSCHLFVLRTAARTSAR